MNAEILTVGDELLLGQVLNTNQAYIAEKLLSVGIVVKRMTTVGDNEDDILTAFHNAWQSYDVVVVTGGLGPTHDDITRACVCRFFQTDLILNEEVLSHIKEFFACRHQPLTPMNEDQARVPRGCTVLHNRLGTAPGYFFEREKKYFIVMPGVPFEMKAIMESSVIPFFETHHTGNVIRYRTLKTTGIPESFLAERIGDTRKLFAPHTGVTLAYLPSPLGVRLRITAQGSTEDDVQKKLSDVEAKLRRIVEPYLYGVDSEEMEDIVGKLLKQNNDTLAVAESCTGGLILHRITNVPGSSEYLDRGYISYSNTAKHVELGVPTDLIHRYGAVSREVAEAMAYGARTKAGTTIGLSVTGIAGPTGGSPEKPVGLVWIGYSDIRETVAYRYFFSGERIHIKERAAQAALEIVRRKLLKIPVEGQ